MNYKTPVPLPFTFFVGRDGKPGPNGEPSGKGGALIFRVPEDDCEVVRFSYSDGIQVNPKFAPDEAARKFWNIVAQCCTTIASDLKHKQAEIERLHSLGTSAIDLCKTREATIERLRAALMQCRWPVGYTGQPYEDNMRKQGINAVIAESLEE